MPRNIYSSNMTPWERVWFIDWVVLIAILVGWLGLEFATTKGKVVMKFLASLVPLLFISTVVHADVIQGGPRQRYDAMSCLAYRQIWTEYSRTLAGGTVTYGPEAQVPGWLSSTSALPPAEQAAAAAFFHLAVLQAAYVGGSSNGPWIGYDQYKQAFAIARNVGAPGSGPIVAAPWPGDYPGLSSNPEVKRAYLVAQTKAALSHAQDLSLVQLDGIEAVMLNPPTCDGVAY